jgi:hypothetical protein
MRWKGFNSRENESIPVEEVGILGVEGHELIEEDVSHRGHAWETVREGS